MHGTTHDQHMILWLFNFLQYNSLIKFMHVQTKLYIEDWIGLRALDEAGRVKFVNVTGKHLHMADDDMKKYIVPYLIDEKAPEYPILTKPTGERTVF